MKGKGNIKEYSLNGKLIFEGEYKNGERNGKGKEYYINDKNNYELLIIKEKLKESQCNINYKLLFEGEYINGERNGKGKEYYYKGNLKFEGEYLNGKKWNGKGFNKNGNIEFEIIKGKGIIKEYSLDGELEFEGEYINGERNGKGKEYYNNILIFEGGYLALKNRKERKNHKQQNNILYLSYIK